MKHIIKSVAFALFLSTIPFSAYAEQKWEFSDKRGNFHSIKVEEELEPDGTIKMLWTTHASNGDWLLTRMYGDCEKRRIEYAASTLMRTGLPPKHSFYSKFYERMNPQLYKLLCK